MPFKSQAQRRKFYAMAERGEIPRSVVEEWERKTPKGTLPERVRRNPSTKGCKGPVFHGTQTASFAKFGKTHKGRTGFHFSDSFDVAASYAGKNAKSKKSLVVISNTGNVQSGNVYAVYLDLGDSLVIDAKGRPWNNIDGKKGSVDHYSKAAKREGYDSLTVKNVSDWGPRGLPKDKVSTTYVVFEPDQIILMSPQRMFEVAAEKKSKARRKNPSPKPKLKSKVKAYHCGRTWKGGKPSLKYIGTGEGGGGRSFDEYTSHNILGPGIYFASKKGVANMYCVYGGTRPTMYTVEIDARGIYDPRTGLPKKLRDKVSDLEAAVAEQFPNKVVYDADGEVSRVRGHKQGIHGPGATGNIFALLGAEKGRKALRKIGVTGVAVTLPTDGPGGDSWEIAVYDTSIVKVLKEEKRYDEEEALQEEFENQKASHTFTLDFYGDWDDDELTEAHKEDLKDARAFFRKHGLEHEHLKRKNPSKKHSLVYYRGYNPGTKQRIIKTGDKEWDSYLFVTDNRESASFYGSDIEVVEFKPSAKILREGTREFVKVAGKWRKGENLLEFCSRAAKAAKAAGYDAVHFKRQTDVGTAVFNEKALRPRKKRKNPSPKPLDPALYKEVRESVKSRVKVWPSAYASAQVVQEYKRRGGRYAGKKPTKSGLPKWFKEDWVDLSRPLKKGGFAKCGRPTTGMSQAEFKRTYPKCVPASKAARMSPAEIKSAVARKRAAEKKKPRGQKSPTYVRTNPAPQFLGPCDRVRRRKGGEEFWQEAMRTGKKISERTFLSNVDVSPLLDEDETWADWRDYVGEEIAYYKSPNAYYITTPHGFEFLWSREGEKR